MKQYDIVLVGAGIMSATMATLIHELKPDAKILILERLADVALESSDAWNNAGTGHSAYCELNYTPLIEGKIDCTKAIKIAEQFELSLQFWTYLVERKIITDPSEFIHRVAHHSWVRGEKDMEMLRQRVDMMVDIPLFSEMFFSNNVDILSQWFPLVTNGRTSPEPMAASRMDRGTDVNFGKLTRILFEYLRNEKCIDLWLEHDVYDIDRNDDNTWKLEYINRISGEKASIDSTYVMVGAGGGALHLLHQAKLREVDGYGGFPVGGKWLQCNNPEVINQHHAKVYANAKLNAPPMSVPHLDTRIIDGKRQLLFGPFAGFSTKFLKHGSVLDFPESIDWDNFLPIIQVGLHNIPLTKYLIDQVRMSFEDKMNALREFYPGAKNEDWKLVEAGQRVQVIKKNKDNEGVLEFGTELILSDDHTCAGLLGASPGASTATSIMIRVIENMFKAEMKSDMWQSKMKEMIPSYTLALNENESMLRQVRERCDSILFGVEN